MMKNFCNYIKIKAIREVIEENNWIVPPYPSFISISFHKSTEDDGQTAKRQDSEKFISFSWFSVRSFQSICKQETHYTRVPIVVPGICRRNSM